MKARIGLLIAAAHLVMGCEKGTESAAEAGRSQRVDLPDSATSGPNVEPHPHDLPSGRPNTLETAINAALDGGGAAGTVNERDFLIEGPGTGMKF